MRNVYVMLGIGVILLVIARARRQTDYFDRPVEAYDPSAATPSATR
jgi:hypothetical protein